MIQTLGQLLVAYRDNLVRLITPATGRDFVESAFGAIQPFDPTTDDDNVNTGGNGFFDAGSRWANPTTPSTWECMDGTPGAAVWIQIFPQSVIPPTPLTPHSLWLLGFEYLTYSGSAFQVGDGVDWCLGFWFKVTSPGPVQVLLLLYDSVSGQATEVIFSSGLLIFSGNAAFGAADVVTAAPTDGLWHFCVVGYDASGSGEAFLSIDAGTRVTQPTTGTPQGITADTANVGINVVTGTPLYPLTGQLEEMFVAGTITDDDIANLYDDGNGLYYDQVPCVFWHTLLLWFPFWEDHAPRVDLVQGVILTPVNDPLATDAICGWRFGVPLVINQRVEYNPGISVKESAWLSDLGATPSLPGPGNFALFVNSGVLQMMDSSGNVTVVAIPGQPNATWMRFDLDYTDFPTPGSYTVFRITLPPGCCFGRAMGLNTIPWLPAWPSGITSISVTGLGATPIWGQITNARLNATETKFTASPDVSNGSFVNSNAGSVTDVYVDITNVGIGMTPTQGHCVIYIELLFLSP